jgi:hypothetical protein
MPNWKINPYEPILMPAITRSSGSNGEKQMVKIAVIQRLLNNLASYVGDLYNATDITHDKYITDIRLQRFVE